MVPSPKTSGLVKDLVVHRHPVERFESCGPCRVNTGVVFVPLWTEASSLDRRY